MFNVIIIGGEDTRDYNYFKVKVAKILSSKAKSGEGITIFTIGDTFVDQFTERYGIAKRFFQTDFKSFGHDALKYRNEAIVKDANAIIFFNNNKRDYKILFDYARNNGLASRILEPPFTV